MPAAKNAEVQSKSGVSSIIGTDLSQILQDDKVILEKGDEYVSYQIRQQLVTLRMLYVSHWWGPPSTALQITVVNQKTGAQDIAQFFNDNYPVHRMCDSGQMFFWMKLWHAEGGAEKAKI